METLTKTKMETQTEAKKPPTPKQVILERYITSPRDMQDIEDAITRHLGGEGHRCAFLRSGEFIRLRLAAMYGGVHTGIQSGVQSGFKSGNTHNTAKNTINATNIAINGGISATLTADERGRLITLHCLDAAVYPPEFERESQGGEGGAADQEAWERVGRAKTAGARSGLFNKDF